MKALLINPLRRAITEVEYDGDFNNIQKTIEARCFDCVRLDDSETIFVDDEGLLNSKIRSHGMFMVVGDNPAFLAGLGMVLATDDEGGSISTTYTPEMLAKVINWGAPRLIDGRAVFIGENSCYDMDTDERIAM